MAHNFNSIRNVAIIAHVNHGKTTLVDALLKQTHLFRENQEEMKQERILDRNDLERERGITILAKNCAVFYDNVKINIIDTPGHVDFSGEVERTLSMADGALLIVDAQEGPMPQTRSVLRQALALRLTVIVVINKIDKPYARIEETLSKIENLFLELATNEKQLCFPILYAVGSAGAVFYDFPESTELAGNVRPLLKAIIENIPEAKGDETKMPKFLVSSLDYDPHVGRIAIGKLAQGKLTLKTRLMVLQTGKKFGVEHLYLYEGLGRVKSAQASTGDIVAISGVPSAQIGMTVGTAGDNAPYSAPTIAQPTLHMVMGANSSPFAGLDGTFVTSRQIEERLTRELEDNLSLRVVSLGSGSYQVSGRGELHLAILLETMRREGYEMEVGKPTAITKKKKGVVQEPYEQVEIVVSTEYEGAVHKECGRRFADIVKVLPEGTNETRLVFRMPTRATLGLRSVLMMITRGTILYASEFLGYKPVGKKLPKLRSGVLVSSHTGETLAYGLKAAQQRGTTFIVPGTEVYMGMIVGQTNRNEDIRINVTKGKQLTNMRSKSSDGIIQLTSPIKMSLEQCLDFLESNELLEVTPKFLRLRKKNLSEVASRLT